MNVHPLRLQAYGISDREYKTYSDLSHDVYYQNRKITSADLDRLLPDFDRRNDEFRGRFGLILAGTEATDGRARAISWLEKRSGTGNSPLTRLQSLKTLYALDPSRARALAPALKDEMTVPTGIVKLREIIDGKLDRERYRAGVRPAEKF